MHSSKKQIKEPNNHAHDSNMQALVKASKIRNQILLPLLLVIGLTAVLRIYLLHENLNQQINTDTLQYCEQVHKSWDFLLQNQAEMLHSHIERLAQDETLKNLWLQQDREKLTEYTIKIMDHLRSDYKLTHFYLIQPDRTCFLRAHQPERSGDIIIRETMRKAAQTQTLSWGLELGPLGTFTLRCVHPWTIDGKFAGYIELGMEIEHFNHKLKDLLHCELATVIYKQHTTREKVENGQNLFGIKSDWNAYDDFVVFNYTTPTPPTGLAEPIHQTRNHQENFVFRTNVQDQNYSCGIVPIPNAAGINVAKMVVMRNITQSLANNKALTIKMATLTIGLLALLLILMYKLLGSLQKKLAEATHKLNKELDSRITIEQRQNALLATIPAYVYFKDSNFKYIMTNRLFENQLKLQSEDIIGKTDYDILNKNDADRFRKQDEHILQSGQPLINQEDEFTVPQGGTIALRSSKAPYQDRTGETIGIVGVSLDITKIKQSEKEKQQAIMQLDNILSSASRTAIIATDNSGMITLFNSGAEKMLGFKAEEMLGQTPEIFHDPAEILAWAQKWNFNGTGFEILAHPALNGHNEPQEWTYIRKDGKKIKVELNINAVKDKDGNTIGFLGIAQDITDRTVSQEKLHRNEKQTSEILNALPAGVIIINARNHQIEYANSAALNMTGYENEKLIGKICHKVVCPNALGNCPITDHGKTVDNARRTMVRQDGTEIPILKTVNRIKFEDKDLLIETFVDISKIENTQPQLPEPELAGSCSNPSGGCGNCR